MLAAKVQATLSCSGRAASAVFRWGPLVILSGSIVYVVLHEPLYGKAFSWAAARHGLWVAGLVVAAAITLLGTLTVAIFACNAD